MWQTGFDTPASSLQGVESRRQHGSCREKRVRVHPKALRGGDGPRGGTPSTCGCEGPRMLRLKSWFQLTEETGFHLLVMIYYFMPDKLGLVVSNACSRKCFTF